MNLGRTAVTVFLSRVGVSVAGFVATFFIARELGSEALGLYTIGVALLFVLRIPLNAIGSGINKRVSEGHAQAAFLSAGVIISVGVGIVLAGALLLGSEFVDQYVGLDVAVPLSLLVMSQAVFTAAQSGLAGKKKVATAGIVQVVERIGRTTFQIGLVLLGLGVIGLYVGYLASLALAAVLSLALLRTRPVIPTREHARSLFEFTRFAWLGKLKSRSFGWMDTIVLAFFVTPDLVGVYEVAWTLSNVLALAGGSIQETLFPELSDLSTRGEVDRIRHFVDEAIVYSGLLAIPGLFGALALGGDLLSIYRPEFAIGATVLVVLIAAQLAALYSEQFFAAVNAVDRPDVAFRINGVFVVVNLVANVALVATVGWVGAAIATATSATLTLVLVARSLSKLIDGISVPYVELAKQLLASLIMLAIVLALQTVLSSGIPSTLALVAVGAVVYGLTVLALSSRVRDKARYLLS
jgi:O-antigen/teichoic acid export membrane protein